MTANLTMESIYVHNMIVLMPNILCKLCDDDVRTQEYTHVHAYAHVHAVSCVGSSVQNVRRHDQGAPS